MANNSFEEAIYKLMNKDNPEFAMFSKLNGCIQTWRDPYCLGYSTTRARQIQFEKGVTVLVGCNGSGKTTLLHNIKTICNRENVAYLSFDNLKEGGANAMESLMFRGDVSEFATMFSSSEGERISQNIGKFASEIGNSMYSAFTEAEEIWLLFDAADSGLSVDNVVELKELLFQTILEDQPDKDIYIVISANEYELARNARCLDVISGKCIKDGFKDYEDYRKFILKSRERKDKRIAKSIEKQREDDE